MPVPLHADAQHERRFRCDPCGFSSGVVVNGRDAPALGLAERTSLSIVACPRCGRRNAANVAWFVSLTGLGALALALAGSWLVQEERQLHRVLGVLAAAIVPALLVVAARRFRGTRRAVRFLPY